MNPKWTSLKWTSVQEDDELYINVPLGRVNMGGLRVKQGRGQRKNRRSRGIRRLRFDFPLFFVTIRGTLRSKT